MISVITPVFNRTDLTQQFIMDICKYLSGHELVIVDNGSAETCSHIVNVAKRLFPKVNIIYVGSEVNTGFGGGNNLGSDFADGDILAFISNDVRVDGPITDAIEKAFEKYPNSIIGHRLINFATGWNEFKELSYPIPYIEGYCTMCRGNTFVDLGKWPKEYFTDYEDLDWGLKAKSLGIELHEINLPMRHLGGQTAATQLPEGRLKYTLESQKKFCEKWGLTIK